MGLDGFLEPGWVEATSAVLRLLLKPSFHPEVCITLKQSPYTTQLSAVVLAEMLWHQRFFRRMQEYREEVTLEPGTFDAAVDGFSKALPNDGSRGNVVSLDGMRIESCCVSGGQVRRLAENVVKPPVVA